MCGIHVWTFTYRGILTRDVVDSEPLFEGGEGSAGALHDHLLLRRVVGPGLQNAQECGPHPWNLSSVAREEANMLSGGRPQCAMQTLEDDLTAQGGAFDDIQGPSTSAWLVIGGSS